MARPARPSTQNNDGTINENLPSTYFSERVDSFLVKIGKGASWLWIVIIIVIFITIIIRYGASQLDIQSESYLGSRLISSVFWEEMSWYLYGYAWLLALAYALVCDDHVRVDLLHEKASRKTQVWIEILGLLFFFFPVFIAIACHGLDFTVESFNDSEGSQQRGLDFRWIPKASISFASVLLLLAGLSRLTRCFKWVKQHGGNLSIPILAATQMIGLFYIAIIFYFMYSWSSNNTDLMAIFRLFGFSAAGD
ncbi:MAG: TRAP transporter small permease subunit [SAR324 cluster bacterium]|nr:TRAP transporter small permease subunit [SAR324 cluster bacterium]